MIFKDLRGVFTKSQGAQDSGPWFCDPSPLNAGLGVNLASSGKHSFYKQRLTIAISRPGAAQNEIRLCVNGRLLARGRTSILGYSMDV